MDPEALAAMARVGTQSVAAYQDYLKGLQLRQEALSSTESGDIFQQAYEHFERAREMDPGFSNAHVEAADFWKVQLTVSRTDTGLTNLSYREILSEYHERIDLASRTARSETDRVRILADQADVDARLRESLELYERYLAERPRDDNARLSALWIATALGEKSRGRELLAHWRERGERDFAAANGFANSAYRLMDPSEAADFALKALRRWPNDDGLLYQTHRTLLWAGRRLEASELASRYRAVVPGSSPLLEAREACSAGDREAAERILAELDPERGNVTSERWMINELLGNEQAIIDILKPLESEGVPYLLMGLLIYAQFDPRPYPTLTAVMDREGIDRPPPVTPPFACPPPERTSVAVLAFENMSPDPENEYFADGISEEILNVLSGLGDLRVIARTSAFSFKGTGATVAEIAEKLDVGYVLEGSVRKAGDRVRVTAQLIETGTESHLWSETYDRDLDDIFAVQDEIARAIAGELELTLTPDQESGLVVAMTENLEAYNKYLLGRQLWHARNIHNLRASAEALREAVTLDPEFAEAWTALADTWVLIPEYDPMMSLASIPAARDAVNRALELKPNLPQALTTRAYIRYMHDYDWENAEKDFLRALDLAPDYPTAHQWYGEFLSVRYRDLEAALEQFRKAAELDPLAPIMWHVAGWVTSSANRVEESIGYYQRALELNANMQHTYGNLALAYALVGEYDRARDANERMYQVLGIPVPDELTLVDALEDPTRRVAYLEVLENTVHAPDGALGKAMEFAILGEHERALANLEFAFEKGDVYAAHANRVRFFDPLREDPRFQAHLAKMNLWPPADR
jgi:TolB-like protein/Tfp pilus assembly protein PilF